MSMSLETAFVKPAFCVCVCVCVCVVFKTYSVFSSFLSLCFSFNPYIIKYHHHVHFILFSFCGYFCNTIKQREQLNDHTEMIVTTLSLKKQTDRQQQQQQITFAKNQIYTKLHKTSAHIKNIVNYSASINFKQSSK